jgi:hypothetical protein
MCDGSQNEQEGIRFMRIVALTTNPVIMSCVYEVEL